MLPHTILLVLAQFVILLLYRYLRTAQSSAKLLDISFIFVQSALICVFCGFFFWKSGILDFIYLYFWTVDFKYVYLNCFAILFLVNYYKNKVELKSSKIKMRDCLLNSLVEFKQFFRRNKLKNNWKPASNNLEGFNRHVAIVELRLKPILCECRGEIPLSDLISGNRGHVQR